MWIAFILARGGSGLVIVGRSSDLRAVAPERQSTGRRFPALPSQCMMTAVVLAYRCGAVPDSHRVPSRCSDLNPKAEAPTMS